LRVRESQRREDKTEITMTRFLLWVGIGTSRFYDWKARFGKVNEHNPWVPQFNVGRHRGRGAP
jgi:hypothetical protein